MITPLFALVDAQFDVHLFYAGVMGSCTLELVDIVRRYQKGGRMAKRHGKFFYWVVRILLALAAGYVGQFAARNEIGAFLVGAAGLDIVNHLTAASRPVGTGRPDDPGSDDPGPDDSGSHPATPNVPQEAKKKDAKAKQVSAKERKRASAQKRVK